MDEPVLLDFLLDYYAEHTYSDGYIKSVLQAIKSWLSHNGKAINMKQIQIKSARDAPTLVNECVLSQELKYNPSCWG